jgi:hypothetical protein
MLWVYAQSDRYFGPEAAQQFRAAFEAGAKSGRYDAERVAWIRWA